MSYREKQSSNLTFYRNLKCQNLGFSKTQDQIKSMGNFYDNMNKAITAMADSVEDIKHYKDQMTVLNKNLTSLNAVYGNVLSAMTGGNKA